VPGDDQREGLWYSGKAHRHGGSIQAVASHAGSRCGSRPPSRDQCDITAARIHALPPLPRGRPRLPALADPGYQGPESASRYPRGNQKTAAISTSATAQNALQRSLRCLGERAFALLNQRWRTLQHITASPSKITGIARAALVLTQYEHGYIK